MSRHDPQVSMRQMRDYANEAVEMVAGREVDDLRQDRMLELALTKLAENIGEAARRVPPEVKETLPNIPWSAAVKTRDRLAHGYDAIDARVLWDTVTRSFRDLIEALDAVLD